MYIISLMYGQNIQNCLNDRKRKRHILLAYQSDSEGVLMVSLGKTSERQAASYGFLPLVCALYREPCGEKSRDGQTQT